MLPIPDPGRLFPPKLPPSRGSGSDSLAGGLLTVGGIGIFLVVAIAGGALAYTLSSWLTIPGGILGAALGLSILEAPPIVLGIIEAVFYFCITYIFSDGFDRPDPGHSLVYSSIVAAVFFWAGFSKWKNR